MNTPFTHCPECHGENLNVAFVNSGGPYGPAFLPGLGSFLRTAQFKVVVCGDCGFTRFYVEPLALAKLPKARAWLQLRERTTV